MENNNTTPTPQVPPVTSVPPIVTPQTPVAPILTTDPNIPMPAQPSFPPEKPMRGNLKTKFAALPRNVKILLVLIPVFIISLLLIALSGLGGRVRNSILPTPTPVPTATPEVPEITNPSAYANDPEVLDLQSKLTDFDKNLSQVELREDTIRPPTVDWDVNFSK